MTQPLATIEVIDSVIKHPNADRLKICKVKGWQVITTDDVKVGDHIIYIQIDTIVKERPEFEFLRNKGFKVRTIKLRGEISQGLIVPESLAFGEHLDEFPTTLRAPGMNVTELIGVTKYEKPIPACLAGTVRGNFPTHLVHKTDEVRLQNYPDVLKEIVGKEIVTTLKIDGTSATYINEEDARESLDFHVCSRNMDLKEPLAGEAVPVYWQIAKELDLTNKVPVGMALQGEIAGPGIMGNPYKLSKLTFFAFNLYDTVQRIYWNWDVLVRFCKKNDIETVPEISRRVFVAEDSHVRDVDNWINEALFANSNGIKAEGYVHRTAIETYSEALKGRLSFKVINNDYALEHGE